MIEPPPLTKGHLSLEDFSNPLDLMRLNQTLKDRVENSFFSEGMENLRSIQKLPSCTRNPFEVLKPGAHYNFASSAPVTSIEAMVNLNLEFKESSVNTSIGFEKPHLRRREIKNFSFERNKTGIWRGSFNEEREFWLQLVSIPLFDDPFSSNPLNMKLNFQTSLADTFKKFFYFPCEWHILRKSLLNSSSSVSLSCSSLYSSPKSSSRANSKRKKCSKFFFHFLKYFIRKKK